MLIKGLRAVTIHTDTRKEAEAVARVLWRIAKPYNRLHLMILRSLTVFLRSVLILLGLVQDLARSGLIVYILLISLLKHTGCQRLENLKSLQ